MDNHSPVSILLPRSLLLSFRYGNIHRTLDLANTLKVTSSDVCLFTHLSRSSTYLTWPYFPWLPLLQVHQPRFSTFGLFWPFWAASSEGVWGISAFPSGYLLRAEAGAHFHGNPVIAARLTDSPQSVFLHALLSNPISQVLFLIVQLGLFSTQPVIVVCSDLLRSSVCCHLYSCHA